MVFVFLVLRAFVVKIGWVPARPGSGFARIGAEASIGGTGH
jgi:hypothetical protein